MKNFNASKKKSKGESPNAIPQAGDHSHACHLQQSTNPGRPSHVSPAKMASSLLEKRPPRVAFTTPLALAAHRLRASKTSRRRPITEPRHRHLRKPPTQAQSIKNAADENPSQLRDPNRTPDLLANLRSDGEPRQILALISLARLPGPDALALLQECGALTSQFRKTRIAALDALGKTRVRTESTTLIAVLQSDTDHSIRAAAAAALSTVLTAEEGVLLEDAGPDARANASRPESRDDIFTNTVEALREAMTKDEHFIVRYSAIVALGNLQDDDAIDLLLPLIQSPDAAPLEIASAIDAVGEIVPPSRLREEWLYAVNSRALHPDDLIRAAVVRTLAGWRSVEGVSATLTTMLKNEVEYGRSTFVLALLQYFIGNDKTT